MIAGEPGHLASFLGLTLKVHNLWLLSNKRSSLGSNFSWHKLGCWCVLLWHLGRQVLSQSLMCSVMINWNPAVILINYIIDVRYTNVLPLRCFLGRKHYCIHPTMISWYLSSDSPIV